MRARWNFRTVLCHVILNVLLFGALVLLYAINEYDNVTLDEIIYHAKHPIVGIEPNVITAFVGYTLIPIFLFNIIYAFITKSKKIILDSAIIIAIAAIYLYSAVRFDIISYNKYSNFIDKNYINPDNVNIAFREKKNLIYIYLESMEISFADKENGGLFKTNLIPNLTQLAHDNINFSGDAGKLNGAYSLPGTTWTMGAVFALNTGLPLKIAVDANDMESQDSFFPGIVSLGDILRKNGYVQEVLLGSKSTFAGQKMFFQQHGNFKVLDYESMMEKKIIPEDYKVFWGVEDHKLIEIAKSELKKLSESGRPFHFSMFTMDTHAPNGYLDDTCENRFDDMQYKNVIYCSDNQIMNFINWIQQQEFYKNTVIVLAGDHPTMKKYFVETGNKEYRRKNYTAYVNVQGYSDAFRAYSPFDQFPTVLFAIGADIPGEKLGLGVNLFSKEKTLVERYGYDALDQELKKRSKFMEGTKIAFPFSKISTNKQLHGSVIFFSKSGNDSIELNVELSNFQWGKTFNEMMTISKIDDIRCIYADFYTNDDLYKKRRIQLIKQDNSLFTGKFKSLRNDSLYHIKIYIQGSDYKGNKYNWITGEIVGIPRFYAADFHDYLKMLDKRQYTIFISAKNDMKEALPDSIVKSLQKFGFHTERKNTNYYAVLDGETIHEESSEQALEYSASLPGDPDVRYAIKSDGTNSEGVSSIVINGKEYSKNLQGLNFVIYDRQLKQVVDSACLDAHSGKLIR